MSLKRWLMAATVLLILGTLYKNWLPNTSTSDRFLNNNRKIIKVSTSKGLTDLTNDGKRNEILNISDTIDYLNKYSRKSSKVNDQSGFIKTDAPPFNDSTEGLIKTQVVYIETCREMENNGISNRTGSKQKVKHIMFLKVHKAGSTTMEYLFFRFAVHYNLTLVLPKEGVYVLTHDDLSDILPIHEGSHYDILASHTVYDSNKISRVLPEDTIKIGIIREPFDRMVSAAFYYRNVRKLPYLLAIPENNFITNLIRNNSIYETNEFSRTKNSMAMDFGFPKGLTQNMTQGISSYISKLSSEFSLVLIMERFEESLILMKRLLQWDIYDVLFIAANKNAHAQTKPDMDDMDKLKSICFLDYALYEHFLKIFENKVVSEGKGFKEEVDHFISILDIVHKFCDNVKEEDSVKINGSQWNCPFILTSRDCKLLKMDANVISMPILRERHIKLQGL